MSDYCEIPEFYSESFPVARKQHRCIECFAPIDKGEKHLRYTGKWDQRIGGGRQHMVCRELCMFIRDKYQNGDCIGFGYLRESWQSMEWKYYRTKGFDERDKYARGLMAKIKWRERAYV